MPQSKPKDPRIDAFVKGGKILRSSHYDHIPAPPQEILAREIEAFRSIASETAQPQLKVCSLLSSAGHHIWQ